MLQKFSVTFQRTLAYNLDMPEIEIDMTTVNQDVAQNLAHSILAFFADKYDQGVREYEMIVALGIVMEIMLEQDDRPMAHTRSH